MTSAPEGPLTFTSLTQEILDVAHGYVREQESVTTLTSPLAAGALSFTVGKPNLVTRGLVEVGDELIYASGFDQPTLTVTIEPWGRGQSGSIDQAHTVGERVTVSPLFPIQRVRSAIYETCRDMFPEVYAVGQAFIDVDVTRTNYPADPLAYQIIEVEWHVPGPSKMWAPMKRWYETHTPDNLELEILGPLWPGKAQCRYRFIKKPPTNYGVVNDDLALYGYDNGVRDIIIYGSLSKLLAAAMSARTQIESMEAHGRSSVVGTTDILAASRYYYQLYRERLEGERQLLLQRHPFRPHFAR